MTQRPNGAVSNGVRQQSKGQKEVKIVIVGDGGCGKTSLLMVYAKGSFPEQYAPSVFEKYTTSITIGHKEVCLHLYDTADYKPKAGFTPVLLVSVVLPCYRSRTRKMMEAPEPSNDGQEDYDRLRPLSYQDVNLVLICFDVTNPTSFDNVLIKWYPEVHHFCRGVPIVLIGCKTDLRMDKERLRRLKTSQQEPVTYFQGEATCKSIQAEEYLECSAKFQENVENVFKEATLIALNSIKKEQRMSKKSKRCLLL